LVPLVFTTPAAFAPTPAESAPITVFNFKENIEGTSAPALPVAATLMMIDGVNPEVLADFAAIRKTKRKGPVTAAVIEEICQQAHLAGLTLAQALQTWGSKPEPQKIPSPIDARLKISLGWAYNRNLHTAQGAIDGRP
jgi:hypothetical protein